MYGTVIRDARHVAAKVINLPYLLHLSVRMVYPDMKAPNLHTGQLLSHHFVNTVSNYVENNVSRNIRIVVTTAAFR